MAVVYTKAVGDLLMVFVSGELTAEEVIAVVDEYYTNGIVKDVIWDLTNGSIKSLSLEDFREIAEAAKDSVISGSRQGGKTVYIGNSDVEYDLLRMYTEIAETTGVTAKYSVVKTIEEVRDWIEFD